MTRQEFETALSPAFFRERAELCSQLAEAAIAAKPLFSRLYFLAEEYRATAKAIEARAARDSSEDSASEDSAKSADTVLTERAADDISV
jgi:hypothetical protein